MGLYYYSSIHPSKEITIKSLRNEMRAQSLQMLLISLDFGKHEAAKRLNEISEF